MEGFDFGDGWSEVEIEGLQGAVVTASQLLQEVSAMVGRPIVLARSPRPDEDACSLRVYPGLGLRPGVLGLTIALCCDAQTAQDLVDLIEDYFVKKERANAAENN